MITTEKGVVDMKINKISLICVALCLCLLACGLFVSCNGGGEEIASDSEVKEEKIEVLRALEDIESGGKIVATKVETVLVCKSDLPAGTLTAEDGVVGKFAIDKIFAGDYFFATKLSNVKPETEGEENMNSSGKLNFDDAGCVLVSEYVKADTRKDVSAEIQKLIDENPNRTLYFPDGEYLISKPIETSADPDKTVSFRFSNYAILRPTETWTKGEPLIKLGAKGTAGDDIDVGNCYVVEGGILDGKNVADAIWVMNGGSVSIRYMAIKYAIVGIHAKKVEGMPDPTVDVTTVNIIGNGTVDSIGVLLETDDNTLTNMRIAANQISVKVLGNNNMLRNLHPLYVLRPTFDHEKTYKDSVAFYDLGTRNYYDNCYSDQFSTGFYLGRGNASVFNNCFCYWYTESYDYHNAFVCEGKFDAVIRMTDAEFDINNSGIECNFLLVGEDGGQGTIDAVFYNADKVSDRDVARDYLINEPIK